MLKTILKKVLNPFINYIARESIVRAPLIDLHSITGKFTPYPPGEEARVISKTRSETEWDEQYNLPVPPLQFRYSGGPSVERYIATGQDSVARMLELLKGDGFDIQPGQRILDFGCAAGRMIRHLYPYAPQTEIWGVDPNAAAIQWAQLHLSPPFKFVTSTTFPHLPFEDNFFDLIYAGSVFTHIPDLADAWLLELRRLLHPDGYLYLTICDHHAIEVLLKSQPGDRHYIEEARLLQAAVQKNPALINPEMGMLAWRSRTGGMVFYRKSAVKPLPLGMGINIKFIFDKKMLRRCTTL